MSEWETRLSKRADRCATEVIKRSMYVVLHISVRIAMLIQVDFLTNRHMVLDILVRGLHPVLSTFTSILENPGTVINKSGAND